MKVLASVDANRVNPLIQRLQYSITITLIVSSWKIQVPINRFLIHFSLVMVTATTINQYSVQQL
uniref:AlNc14C395G11320 protein n=1 Tax=Albugo laibachii Nc14 TaxID=890382 RepID=F0WYQ8_9STRA|nr:AlNc14C395G11320 [Albugo laibachii Nc14]|eukprot:CCA26617.1 AlNc14C395G11320 [Albugo laibachii Nc14]